MIITILGSSAFCKEKVEFKRKLLELGHVPLLLPHNDEIVAGRMQDLWKRVQTEHAELKKEFDLIRIYYEYIKMSEAVFVLNLDKKGIKNYIGGNALMELGFAYYLHKKIFLMNPIPEISYTDEIKAMEPIILNGDLSKIS